MILHLLAKVATFVFSSMAIRLGSSTSLENSLLAASLFSFQKIIFLCDDSEIRRLLG